MNLRNQHIGLAVGLVVMIAGYFLSAWDPGETEAALIVVSTFGSAVGLSIFLDLRDIRRGRGSFRR